MHTQTPPILEGLEQSDPDLTLKQTLYTRSVSTSKKGPSVPSLPSPASDLVIRCAEIGVTLRVEAGSLRYSGPRGAMTPELSAELSACKGLVIALLSAPDPPEKSPAWSPRLLPWRPTVAGWPIQLRQTWGNRANTLQDSGIAWHEAERVAFEEVRPSAPIRPIRTAEPSRPSWDGDLTETVSLADVRRMSDR